jgi:phage terminase large subunit-like protein
VVDKDQAGLDEILKLVGSPEAAELYIDEIQKKRKKEQFLRYWQPFDYQKKVFEIFKENVKILVVCGGNRSGKTEVGTAITLAWAEGKDSFKGEPGWSWAQHLPIPEKLARNIWVVGMDFNVLRDVIWRDKFMTGAMHPGFVPKDGSVADIRETDKQIFFTNNAVITGKSADSGREKFQSASCDLVWIDEEVDADVFDECYQRTVDCKGKILVTVTPLTDVSSGVTRPWLYELYEEMKQGRKDIAFVYLSFLDNPIVPKEEKDAAIAFWSGKPDERARLFGEFVRRSGLVYPTWDRRKHLVPPMRPPHDWYRFVSIDPAATGVTAALWGAVDPSGNIHLYKEYYDRDMVVSEHVKNIRNRNAGEIVDLWILDPTWGKQRNAESHKTGAQLYRDCGLPVRLPDVGDDFGLNVSMEYVNATVVEGARHPKLYVCSDLKHFISEIEHYVWDSFQRGNLKGLSKEKPQKRNDHLLNAFQYACSLRPKPKMRLETQYNEDELRRRAASNSYF